MGRREKENGSAYLEAKLMKFSYKLGKNCKFGLKLAKGV